jgi:protein gp37
MKIEWVRVIRDQCLSEGLPFFFKQWGGFTSKSGGRILDSKEWGQFPTRDARTSSKTVYALVAAE